MNCVELLTECSDTAIVRLDGILSYLSAKRIEQELGRIIETHHVTSLQIDMAQVRFIDSAGLLSLFNVLSTAKALGKNMILCCAPPCVRLVLRITGMEPCFTLSESLLLS